MSFNGDGTSIRGSSDNTSPDIATNHSEYTNFEAGTNCACFQLVTAALMK